MRIDMLPAINSVELSNRIREKFNKEYDFNVDTILFGEDCPNEYCKLVNFTEKISNFTLDLPESKDIKLIYDYLNELLGFFYSQVILYR